MRGLSLLALTLAACALPEAGGVTPASDTTTTDDAELVTAPIVDLRVDSNRDGTVDVSGGSDDAIETGWNAQRGAVVLANLDDDSQRCSTSPNTSDAELARCNDAADTVVNGSQDLLDLAPMRILAWPKAPLGSRVDVTVSPAGKLRLFYKEGSSWVFFDHDRYVLTSEFLRKGVELRAEALDIVRDRASWDGYVDVMLTVTTPKANGQPGKPGKWDGGALYEEILVTDTVRMRVAPVLTFSQQTPVVTGYATLVRDDQDSLDFRNDLKAALSASDISQPLVSLDPPEEDQWTKDFFETGYMSMPASGGMHAIRVALRSANLYQPNSASHPLRVAGKIVFTGLRGPNVAGIEQYRAGSSSHATLDSFGNFETIPPYGSYPLGRIVRGSVSSYHPDSSFLKMMEGQALQPPVYVDTSWLLVGHIDETVSFLPANTPRGWILLVNDPALARTMLQQQVSAGNGGAVMFPGMSVDDGYGGWVRAERTISQVLADPDVMQESAATAIEIQAQLDIIKQATGLTNAEIVRVPFLHEPVDGYSLAYQPGTVNGFAINGSSFAAPDPHGPVIGGQDLFKVQLKSALAAYGYTVRWVENWYLYHLNAGEVHCGSNATRVIPSTKWWEAGR